MGSGWEPEAQWGYGPVGYGVLGGCRAMGWLCGLGVG